MFLQGKENRRNPSLLDAGRSVLLVIDAQEKFLPVIPGMPEAVKRMVILAKAVGRLGVPAIASEQYPKALGATLPEVAAALPLQTPIVSKLCFSSFEAPEWAAALRAGKRNQFVLCGVETHVCVLQTALDLLQNPDWAVYVVEDAVASRKESDKAAALRRMEAHGVQRVTSEMVVFEWLRAAGTAEFKEIQALVK